MKNPDGTWRTNYFDVRSFGQFMAWVEAIDADYNQLDDGRVMVFDATGTGLLPGERVEEEGFGVGSELLTDLGRLLAPDPENVCVLMQVCMPVGHTIVGKAYALRATELGEPSVVLIDLYDIYGQAQDAFGLKDQPEPA